MTALACLQIVVGADAQHTTEQMAEVVEKVTSAYLETTWLWPRRFGVVAPFAFALADPRVTSLDPRELQELSRQLQHKLFGDDGAGAVDLLTFEGEETEIMRFASLKARQLVAIMQGLDPSFDAGRICRITPTAVYSLKPEGGPICGRPSREEIAKVVTPPPVEQVGYRGVFHIERQAIIGNVAVCRDAPSGAPSDAEHAKDGGGHHDGLIMLGVIQQIESFGAGVLLLPMDFTTLTRPTGRAYLKRYAERLPEGRRRQLAAAVYNAPRSPTHHALSDIRSALEAHFSRIDLRVADPAFDVLSLPQGMVTSVTLVLPEGSEATRLAALERFMQSAPDYRARRVNQGVGEVRTAREFRACIDRGAPFVTGPAVSGVMDRPIEVGFRDARSLPVRERERGAGEVLAPALIFRLLPQLRWERKKCEAALDVTSWPVSGSWRCCSSGWRRSRPRWA